jgi:predicted extracellular nuclease
MTFYESLEGMRVCVVAPRVVQGTRAGGEVWVVAGDAGLSTRGALAVEPGDQHPERIQLVAPGMPRFAVGDVLSDVRGVMSYRGGNYTIQIEVLPVKRSGQLSREIAGLGAGEGSIRVASFNVHNLGLDEPERMDEIARLIVSHLGAPEILGLQEIVDDSGSEDDGVVDATLTLRALVDAIHRADGPAYDFREVLPCDGADGGAPGSNIRVVLLFDHARVKFVDRGDSSGSAETRFASVDARPRLTRSPGRIAPVNPAWAQSRKPLACELRIDGRTVFVIVCHFVSKSRSSPLFGALQPPVDPDATRRRRQAELVAQFVADALAIDSAARVIVLGDLNDDWFSPAIAALEQTPLSNLWATLPLEERYSYLFDGNAQTFDHVLVSPALLEDARFDVVHVAAEFAGGVSDHDPVVASVRVSKPEPVATAFTLSPPQPNPSSGHVVLRVDGSTPVRAEVFDVAGRSVTALPTGGRIISWGGHDNAGRKVPAGVYWIRVSDGVSTRARKVVRLR